MNIEPIFKGLFFGLLKAGAGALGEYALRANVPSEPMRWVARGIGAAAGLYVPLAMGLIEQFKLRDMVDGE